MATDYDTPRSVEGEEDQEQSLEALKARRAEAAADLGDDADPFEAELDLPGADLSAEELTVRVLKMNRKRGNVVVSRRAILDEQVASQRQAMLDSMAEGQTVKGIVKNVTGSTLTCAASLNFCFRVSGAASET